MVADSVILDISPAHLPAGDVRSHAKSLDNRTRVGFAATQIIDFGDARGLPEFVHEAGYVFGMDVVPHLLALVAEHFVFAALDVALHQITEEPVQFHAGAIRTGQAAAAQAAGWHIEIPAVLLHHDIRRELRRAEQGRL